MLGDERILYSHIPSPILGSFYGFGKYVYCPAIDTYADAILRAEHIENFDEKTLRYSISGRNISNTLGFVCNYDYTPEATRKLIPHLFQHDARLPYWVNWDIYVKSRCDKWNIPFHPEAETHRIMHEEYFPLLEKLRLRKR